MMEKIGPVIDHIVHLPWLMIGMTRPPRRTNDEDDSGMHERTTDPTLRMWGMLSAAVLPFLGGMIWVQSEIRGAVRDYSEAQRREFASYAESMERRVAELERFRLAGSRFTGDDGNRLRKEILEHLKVHEDRIDMLEKNR